MSIAKSAVEIANASGFPLQIAVEHQVRNSRLGWSVYSVEHPWKNDHSGESGFIDLILEKWNVFLTLECKRVRDSSWIFLLPKDDENRRRRHAVGWVSVEDEAGSGHFAHFGWNDLSLSPSSPQSMFCAIRGQEAHTRSLERVASELVAATEAFAFKHPEVRANARLPEIRRFYFNVIVTTAQLAICEFQPDAVSLKDGTVDVAQTTIVPFVRFAKALSTSTLGIPREATYVDYGQEHRHTTFVVNAEHLLNFLEDFELDVSAIAKYAPQ
jgi:hypothetical protein